MPHPLRIELKKILISAFIILCLFITSCSQDLPLDGKVCFVSIALDYSRTRSANTLKTPENDQQMILQTVRSLLSEDDEIKIFSSFGEPSSEDPENYVTILRFESFIDTLDLEEKDVLVIHYSGHGDTDGSLAFDSNVDGTGYQLYKPSALLNKLNSLKCNKVLLLDSCYSGRFVAEKPYLSDSWENAIKNFRKNSDTSKLWVISACDKTQQAPDAFSDINGDVKNNGILSYCLNEYLKGERKDYTVQGIYRELLDFTRNGVTENISDFNYHATRNLEPQTNLTPYDLVLFRRRTAK